MVRVLVVDDDANLRKMVTDVLSEVGNQTVEAVNGRDALDILKRNSHFDLILSDLKMPEMDGYQLLSELGSDYPTIPVIIMSVHLTYSKRDDVLQKGAVDYLQKPFSTRELLRVIDAAIRTANH
jgi:CheY-like chemotaxis protein